MINRMSRCYTADPSCPLTSYGRDKVGTVHRLNDIGNGSKLIEIGNGIKHSMDHFSLVAGIIFAAIFV